MHAARFCKARSLSKSELLLLRYPGLLVEGVAALEQTSSGMALSIDFLFSVDTENLDMGSKPDF